MKYLRKAIFILKEVAWKILLNSALKVAFLFSLATKSATYLHIYSFVKYITISVNPHLIRI